jgi:hypothetical protein
MIIKKTQEDIIADIINIINSHEPQDIMEGLCIYCERSELDIENVVKIIKKSEILKKELYDLLISVRVVS